MRTVLALVSILASACGVIPETVRIDDPRLAPMWQAAELFDRATFGFSPLPDSGVVRLETRPRAGYDAMIHINFKSSRTIAFRKTESGYRWIGEQELFWGPGEYKTVDGIMREHITLTFETENVSGHPTNVLSVSYHGEDPRPAGRTELSLAEVQPILREWGY